MNLVQVASIDELRKLDPRVMACTLIPAGATLPSPWLPPFGPYYFHAECDRDDNATTIVRPANGAPGRWRRSFEGVLGSTVFDSSLSHPAPRPTTTLTAPGTASLDGYCYSFEAGGSAPNVYPGDTIDIEASISLHLSDRPLVTVASTRNGAAVGGTGQNNVSSENYPVRARYLVSVEDCASLVVSRQVVFRLALTLEGTGSVVAHIKSERLTISRPC
jgi:hypothetical protein